MSSSIAATNSTLASKVKTPELNQTKQQLEHVPLDVNQSGSVHLGPGPHASTIESSRMLQGGDISVHSSVTTDTTQCIKQHASKQINDLLTKLATTTAQIDQYSRRANEEISKHTTEQLQRVIANTQREQDLLLKDASSRSLEIENVYTMKLKAFVQELDAAKAANLASLERDLVMRQEDLLAHARDAMDSIYAAETAQKIAVMQKAQQQAGKQTEVIAEQVKTLGATEVERAMNSTTTTVITTNTVTSPGDVPSKDSLRASVVENQERSRELHVGEPKNRTGRV